MRCKPVALVVATALLAVATGWLWYAASAPPVGEVEADGPDAAPIAPRPVRAPVRAPVPVREAPPPSRPPELAMTPAQLLAAPRDGRHAATAIVLTWPVAPAAYDLPAGTGRRVVNLAGGAPTAFSLAPPAPDDRPTRHVTGHVVDAGGHPAAGAIVLAGASFVVEIGRAHV